jgi:hypothetical protein
MTEANMSKSIPCQFLEQSEQRRNEEMMRRESRLSSERRIDPQTGVPLNLFELLKSDPAEIGFLKTDVYLLELRHRLMGFFPAVFSAGDRRIVIVTNLELLESVWRMLEPRSANIIRHSAFVHQEKPFAYICKDQDSDDDREREAPKQLLTRDELAIIAAIAEASKSERGTLSILDVVDSSSEQIYDVQNPLRWAHGLISGHDLMEEDYFRGLENQAMRLSPTFRGRSDAA